MRKLIAVADWGADSLTCQEVRIAIEGYLKDPSKSNISFVSSTPSTIHTGFIINQVCETEERYGRPLETVVYQNTDPRIGQTEAVEQAKGAEFIIVSLYSGIYICGPNAGFNYSLVKAKIAKVYRYEGMDKGRQFRSRDLFTRIGAYFMDSLEQELDLEEIGSDIIPVLSGWHIGHIDNYGNIKTTITHEEFKGKYEYGDEVLVKINKVTKKVKYVSNLFGSKPGDLVIYPGSSGKPDNPYLEISVWRHFDEESPTTGLAEFNTPRPGQGVKIGQNS